MPERHRPRARLGWHKRRSLLADAMAEADLRSTPTSGGTSAMAISAWRTGRSLAVYGRTSEG